MHGVHLLRDNISFSHCRCGTICKPANGKSPAAPFRRAGPSAISESLSERARAVSEPEAISDRRKRRRRPPGRTRGLPAALALAADRGRSADRAGGGGLCDPSPAAATSPPTTPMLERAKAPVAPSVNGPGDDIYVRENQFVRKGLAAVPPTPRLPPGAQAAAAQVADAELRAGAARRLRDRNRPACRPPGKSWPTPQRGRPPAGPWPPPASPRASRWTSGPRRSRPATSSVANQRRPRPWPPRRRPEPAARRPSDSDGGPGACRGRSSTSPTPRSWVHRRHRHPVSRCRWAVTSTPPRRPSGCCPATRGSKPTSRKTSSPTCRWASRCRSRSTPIRTPSWPAMWPASRPAPARPSRRCRRRTPPATG